MDSRNNMARILFAPHNDDEGLFASFIIQRLRPLLLVIVTDSYIQSRRGDPITWQQRRQESADAARLLKVPICYLSIPDVELTQVGLADSLQLFSRSDEAIAPALQGGNAHHDMVACAALDHFRVVRQYATYAKGECFTPLPGVHTIVYPTEEEFHTKARVLACYETQNKLSATRPHFEAVHGQPEYLT